MKNIPEALKKLLPEEALTEIVKAFDAEVELHVESALATYDAEASDKIKNVLKVVDESWNTKFNRVKEKTIDTINAYKEAVNKKHTKELQEEASRFKDQLSKAILRYIDLKIENIVPYDTIKEAAHNSAARLVLEGLRKQLSVDTVLMKESVSKPLLDMKNLMAEMQNDNKRLAKENKLLQEKVEQYDNNILIESRVAVLPQDEADHMRRLMNGKSSQFISENFDYTLSIYRSTKAKRHDELKAKALKTHANSRSTLQEADVKAFIPKKKQKLVQESFESDEDTELISDLASSYGLKY